MKIDCGLLKAASKEILIACGESAQGAEYVADYMVLADKRGITTHGTYLLTPIYKRAKVNQITLPTNVTVVSDKGATAVVNGGDGLGAVACKAAVDLAIKKAKEFGISTVLVRDTNNIGALATYTEQAARAGMIAIMSCNAASAIAPWGAADAFMGTNPIAVAIYTGQDKVFSADMASSIVARGKIRKAARNGEQIPKDWAMDENGNFTTDPNAALKGALLPMAGPKGSALALAVDIISGMLSGASYAPNLKSFHEPEGPTGVGASLIVIDVEKFVDLEEFKKDMTGYIATVKGMRKAQGVNEIYMPGEIEYNKQIASEANGVELDANAIAAINEILEKIGSKTRIGG